jgi:hypothetical protein
MTRHRHPELSHGCGLSDTLTACPATTPPGNPLPLIKALTPRRQFFMCTIRLGGRQTQPLPPTRVRPSGLHGPQCHGHGPLPRHQPDALEVPCSDRDGTAHRPGGSGVKPLEARMDILRLRSSRKQSCHQGGSVPLVTVHGLGEPRADAAVAVQRHGPGRPNSLANGHRRSLSPDRCPGLRVASLANATQTAWQFPSGLTTALRLYARP